MVSGAILTFARFLKIGRSWSEVWGFHRQAICIYFVYAKSMLATSCGGQLSTAPTAPVRTPFASKIVKIMELVEI